MTLDVGTPYQASLTITNAAGVPVNPSAAVLTVTLPDQTTQTVNVALPPAQTGVLVSDPYISTQGGLHKLVWSTTAPSVPKTDYVNFRNYVSAISLDDGRDRLGLRNTKKDEQVRNLCGVATRLVENRVGTLVVRTFTDEHVPGSTRDIIRVQNGPIFDRNSVISLKSVYPMGTSWDTRDATLGTGGQLVITPRPGTIRLAGLYPFWYGPWLISYKAGWCGEIPEPIIEAIREVLFDLWSSYRGLTADLAESAEQMAMVVPPFYRLPARALAMIKDYELPGFG